MEKEDIRALLRETAAAEDASPFVRLLLEVVEHGYLEGRIHRQALEALSEARTVDAASRPDITLAALRRTRLARTVIETTRYIKGEADEAMRPARSMALDVLDTAENILVGDEKGNATLALALDMSDDPSATAKRIQAVLRRHPSADARTKRLIEAMMSPASLDLGAFLRE